MKDKPGVLARIADILGRHKVSIASVHQDGGVRRGVPIVIVTHQAPEGAVQDAMKEADGMSAMIKKVVRLRIEDFK
jgi:homoserine dehydrogenase